jgi:hypothetical protein
MLDIDFKFERKISAVHMRLNEHDSAIAEHGQRLGELEETADDQYQVLDSLAGRAISQADEITAQPMDRSEEDRKFAPRFTRRHVAAVTAIAAVAAYAAAPKLQQTRVGASHSTISEAHKPTHDTERIRSPLQHTPVSHSNKSVEKHHAKKTRHVEKAIPAARAAKAVTSKSVQIIVPVKQPASVSQQPKSATPEIKPAKHHQPVAKKPKTSPRTPNGGASYGSHVPESTAAQVGGSAPYGTSAPSANAGGAIAP